MTKLTRIGIGMAATLLLATAGLAADKAEVGKAAPDFTLKDTEGKEHKLADYKGKIVVLEWINHECPVVVKYHKAKTVSNTQSAVTKAEAGKADVVWLSIDSTFSCQDNVDKIKAWNKEMGVSYPTLLDAAGTVGKSYGATNTPHIFVIDGGGTLVYAGAIDDTAGERNYVSEAVSAVRDGKPVEVATTKARGCSVKYKK